MMEFCVSSALNLSQMPPRDGAAGVALFFGQLVPRRALAESLCATPSEPLYDLRHSVHIANG